MWKTRRISSAGDIHCIYFCSPSTGCGVVVVMKEDGLHEGHA